MRYLNTTTLRQETESNSGNIIDSDARVSNWFKPCPDGYEGEWIDDTYTFVLIPLPTQDELDTIALADAEYDAQLYARNREAEYPTIAELTISLFDAGDKAALVTKRAAVKTKWPKDNSGPVE